jgi:hypothetical protein
VGVYRDLINTAPEIVQCVYFSGRPETCSLTFEFDPADMIDEGEGWIYRTSTLSLKTAIDVNINQIGCQLPLVRAAGKVESPSMASFHPCCYRLNYWRI